MGGSGRDSSRVDWSETYDLIASEYGYSWERFTSMTYKFLDACLLAIEKRSHNKTVVQAAMRGIKMDIYRRHKPVTKKMIDFARSEANKLLKDNREAIKSGK